MLNITNITLVSMNYNKNTNVVTYYFDIDGIRKYFQAKLHGGVSIEILNDLEGYELSRLPYKSSELIEITYRYVRGKKVIFPIQLFPHNNYIVSENEYEQIIMLSEGNSLETLFRYSRPYPTSIEIPPSFTFEHRKEIFFWLLERLMKDGHLNLGKKGKLLEGTIEEQIDLFRKTLPTPRYHYPFWDQPQNIIENLLPNLTSEEPYEIPDWFNGDECPATAVWVYPNGYVEWTELSLVKNRIEPSKCKEKLKISKIEYKSINLSWIHHDKDSDIITYCFDVDGKVKYFQAKLVIYLEVAESIKCIGNFDNWLMSVMPFQSRITGILARLSWDYAKGREISFPVQLIS
ncbi:DUF596 domain-containing protein [Xenorhabdus miraniensis]|uniref:Uncharacterized protein n=1 Tax=Xenorhabdus miraniensis TaxID=351674 RepID=A0A2D0JJL1_9GAMM|nr:DUF596 domain-containing protein [Xenorhabdus miraniensis]PHM45616.1 hypothetical protein Xmir_04215 [Xenorhabdus miraniensis]